jgi:hypothetical protein
MRFSSYMHDDHSEFSHDHYQSMELWGGYNWKKTQIIAFAPYVFSSKQTDDGQITSNGMGDVMIVGTYRIFSSSSLSKDETVTKAHQLSAGFGIKLPTGASDLDPNVADFVPGDFNSQPGTGSVDFMLLATHNVQWNSSGIVTSIAYRLNTTNSDDFRFGNRTYVSSAWFYSFYLKNLGIKPNIGVAYQSNSENKFANEAIEGSNGYILQGTSGINILYDKVGFNTTYFLPVFQQLNNGQTKLSSRIVIGLTYSF